jgi:RHS repeat-associated protein
MEVDDVRITLATSIRRYTHHDFRGNVHFVTDESGQPVRRHVYHGFGERRVVDRDGTSRSPADGERGFAQGLHLAGLMLMGARPYDPDSGRFLAPDPIDQVLNDFAYTRGNPVRLWDPGGMQASPTPGTMSPAGESALVIGAGFMTLGAGITAVGFSTGTRSVVALGIVTFFIGVTIAGSGGGMTHVQGPGGDSGESEFAEGGPGSTSAQTFTTCAPDGFVPHGGRRVGLVALLLAMIVAVDLCRAAGHPR